MVVEEKNLEPVLYLHHMTSIQQLKDGFMPLGHFIVVTGARKIMDAKLDMERCGLQVLSIETDCIRQRHEVGPSTCLVHHTSPQPQHQAESRATLDAVVRQ